MTYARDDEERTEMELRSKGLNAPRVTPADIDAAIVSETYTILPSGRTTICELTLRNGFTVRGESTCVSIENFDLSVGRRLARESARNQIWGLEAYLLTQRLYEAQENQ